MIFVPKVLDYIVSNLELGMNKGELIDSVAEKAGVTKKEADAVVSAALNVIVKTVSNSEKVTLVGFGAFESRLRKET